MWYKVVDKRNGGRYSACRSDNFPEEYRVAYKLNEWVGPNIKGTRLFCFKNLEDAKRFKNTIFSPKSWTIYECDVKNPAKVKYVASPKFIKNFWKFKKLKRSILDFVSISCPDNTYSCSSIKLLRKVKENV